MHLGKKILSFFIIFIFTQVGVANDDWPQYRSLSDGSIAFDHSFSTFAAESMGVHGKLAERYSLNSCQETFFQDGHTTELESPNVLVTDLKKSQPHTDQVLYSYTCILLPSDDQVEEESAALS